MCWHAHVRARQCVLGCVCFCVRACARARLRACVRACVCRVLRRRWPSACRGSRRDCLPPLRVTRWIGIHGFTPSSLPPLPYLPCVCSAGDRDRQPAAVVSVCRISPGGLAIGAHDPGKPEGTSGSIETVESDGAVPSHGQPPSESPSRADPRRISLWPGPASLSHAAGRGAESGSVAGLSFRISGRSGSRPGGRGQRPAQSCP